MTINQFKNLFNYDQNKVGHVGVERECFICDQTGRIVPHAHKVLSGIERGVYEDSGFGLIAYPEKGAFGYELSASQVESRVGPCLLGDLGHHLQRRDRELETALRHYGLSAMHAEVGPKDMPLDVYPDPTGRYQKITKDMPREILSAACRVIGTHVHVGMQDHDTALRVYNRVIQHCAELCEVGDGSFGERLAIYKQMAPDFEPKPYLNWDEYYQTAITKGFAEDPRKCWTLIRISVHGTIEFRMFGATDSIDRIVEWANRCHSLCLSAA
ncbi:hypothetical protein HY970_00880 [Candidatus Kaiserbacteria bacterium]|nr:hypothetical protein [Candidatus Kaiserbacteria bacterium]